MLIFLTMADNRGPLRRYLRWWGGALQGRVRLIPYEAIVSPEALTDGTYIFSDIERLSHDGVEHVTGIWNALAERGDSVRLLNRPGTMLSRHELLRTLYQRGINRFMAYGIEERREDIRYPVFVRHKRAHTGPLSGLLYDRHALDQGIATAVAEGTDPSDILIVEFLDTQRDRIYRKYAVVKVGPALIAQHVFFDRNWVVKATTEWSQERIREDNQFMLANPHRDELSNIFDLAGVDFGRVDYAFFRDSLQVWEINTVPTLLLHKSFYDSDRIDPKRGFSRRFNAALAALDATSRTPRLLDRAASYRDIYL